MELDRLIALMKENGWVFTIGYPLTFHKCINNENCFIEILHFGKNTIKVESCIVSYNIRSKDDIKRITIALNRLKEEEQKIRGLLENEIRNEH